MDRFTRARVASFTGLAVLDGEDAQTGNGDIIAIFQTGDDRVDHYIDGFLGAGFGGANRFGHRFNYRLFVHIIFIKTANGAIIIQGGLTVYMKRQLSGKTLVLYLLGDLC